MRTCVGAFLSNRRGMTQLWIDLGIDLGERMHNLLRLIFVHDINRLLFTGSILVSEFGFLRRHNQRLSGAWVKCHATEAENEKGGDFSHKERVISVILTSSASGFFKKIVNF